MTNRYSRIVLFSGKMLGAPLVLAGLVVVAPAPLAAQAPGDLVVDIGGNLYPKSAFQLDSHPTPHHHALGFPSSTDAVPFTGSNCIDPGAPLGFGLLTFFPFSSSSGTSSGTGGLPFTGAALAAITRNEDFGPIIIKSNQEIHFSPSVFSIGDDLGNLSLDKAALFLFDDAVLVARARSLAAWDIYSSKDKEFSGTARARALGAAANVEIDKDPSSAAAIEAAAAADDAREEYTSAEWEAYREAHAALEDATAVGATAPAAGGAAGADIGTGPIVSELSYQFVYIQTPAPVQAADTAMLGATGGIDLTGDLQTFLDAMDEQRSGQRFDLGSPSGQQHFRCNHISTRHPGDEMCILSLRQD